MMSHPVHVLGHSFEVTEIDGQSLPGAIRDVILVPPRATVKVAFDADNPSLWACHCHNLYQYGCRHVRDSGLSRLQLAHPLQREDLASVCPTFIVHVLGTYS